MTDPRTAGRWVSPSQYMRFYRFYRTNTGSEVLTLPRPAGRSGAWTPALNLICWPEKNAFCTWYLLFIHSRSVWNPVVEAPRSISESFIFWSTSVFASVGKINLEKFLKKKFWNVDYIPKKTPEAKIASDLILKKIYKFPFLIHRPQKDWWYKIANPRSPNCSVVPNRYCRILSWYFFHNYEVTFQMAWWWSKI